MKPRNREITIFNLSMLDVISGAVGAFLIITVVLFPSYAKNVLVGQKNLEEFKKVRERLSAELQQAMQKPRPDLGRVEDKNRQLKEALAKLRQQEQGTPDPPRPAIPSNLGPVLVVTFSNTGYTLEVEVLPELPGVPAFDPKKRAAWRDPSHYVGTSPEVNNNPRLVLVPRPIPGVSYRIYYKLVRSVRNKERKIKGELSYGSKTWKLPIPTIKPGRGMFMGSFRLDPDGTLFFSAANGKLQKVFENLNRRQLERLKSERRKSESQRAKKSGK